MSDYRNVDQYVGPTRRLQEHGDSILGYSTATDQMRMGTDPMVFHVFVISNSILPYGGGCDG